MTEIPRVGIWAGGRVYERLLDRAPDFVAIEGREVLWQVRDLAPVHEGGGAQGHGHRP